MDDGESEEPFMEGEPEGTGTTGQVRAPRWALVLLVIFVIYLIFRLIQAVEHLPQIIHWLSEKL